MALVTTWNYMYILTCGVCLPYWNSRSPGLGSVHLEGSWVNESGAQDRGVVFLAGGDRGGDDFPWGEFVKWEGRKEDLGLSPKKH